MQESETTDAMPSKAREFWFNKISNPFMLILCIFTIALQWFSLIQICNTKGAFGFGNFITTSMILSSFGFHLREYKSVYQIIVFSSYLFMTLYYLKNNW
jgi:hypothetical protein